MVQVRPKRRSIEMNGAVCVAPFATDILRDKEMRKEDIKKTKPKPGEASQNYVPMGDMRIPTHPIRCSDDI